MIGDGIHDMLREDYDRLSRANFSKLKLFAQSPAHYREQLLHPDKDKDKDAYRLGRCTHLSAFEPETFRERCVVWDLGTRRGADWEEFKLRHKEREILTEKEHAQCLAIGEAARSHPVAARHMSNGRGEVTILWTFRMPAIGALPALEMPCKSRVDFLQEEALVDLKTCKDASPRGFGRAAWDYQYHAQAAFYLDAVFAVTGRRLSYKIIAVEKTPPYVVQVYAVPDELIGLGRETYRTWLEQLAHCRKDSNWPGYAEGELDLTLPSWAAPREEDEDAAGLGLVINQ